ncbi:uncharacterized protein [Halyomorpha halys]|uniref:uncharacterized protein n=1 Tax=Halyomorpha halys TaxID=286706 RepID=UPI0034D34B6C
MKEFWKKNISGAIIENKNNHVKVSSLAFADDLALLAESEEEAISQINTLQIIAEKAGLQISYEKTELMTTEVNFKKKIVNTEYQRIKVTRKFKYLGEIICHNGSKKESIREKTTKLENLSFQTAKIYNKKNLSSNAMLKHYNVVVRPVILYGVETTCLPNLEKLLKIERRILRKIYWPRKTQEGYSLRSNEQICRNIKDLETKMRVRRLMFYGLHEEDEGGKIE